MTTGPSLGEIGSTMLFIGFAVLMVLVRLRVGRDGSYRWRSMGRAQYPWPTDPGKSRRFTIATLLLIVVVGAVAMLVLWRRLVP